MKYQYGGRASGILSQLQNLDFGKRGFSGGGIGGVEKSSRDFANMKLQREALLQALPYLSKMDERAAQFRYQYGL